MKRLGIVGGLAALVLGCCGPSEDKEDAGVPDACVSCSKPDTGYQPPVDGGSPLDGSVQDAGCDTNCYVDGGSKGDGGVDGGNLPPIITEIYTSTDREGSNRTTTFTRGSTICLHVVAADSDCSQRNNCGSYHGIKDCNWKDNLGNSGGLFPGFPAMGRYPNFSGTIIYDVSCLDNEDASSEIKTVQVNVN